MDRIEEAAGLVLPAGGLDALERNEARFRSMVSAFSDFLFVCSPEGRLLTDMPPWRAVTGQTTDELLGYGWLDGVHPDDRERVAQVWAQAVATEQLYVVEYRITGPGGVRHLSVRGAPVRDATDAIVEWIGSCDDVTEARRNEAARRQLEQDLRGERETLRLAIEQASIGMLLLEGRNLIVSEYNDHYLAMLPAGRIEVGRRLFDAVPEAEHLRPELERVLAGETLEFRELPIAFEDSPLTLDGFRYYDVTYTPVTGTDGEPGVLAVVSEVTDELRRRSDLEQRLEAERRLGAELQRTLLPETVPAIDALDIAVRYAPASDRIGVGGDWYDVLTVAGHTTLVIGDVCGNGLPAATAMAQLRAAIRAYVLDGLRPATVLERASRYCARLKLAEMATAVVLQLRPETGDLSWAGAGHPPPLLTEPDGSSRLLWAPPGPPLGTEDAAYDEHDDALAPDGAIVLYTDGLVQGRRRSLDESLQGLRDTVSGRWASAGELRDVISRRLPGRGEDDVALLVCRRPPGDRVHRRFAPLPHYVSAMRDLAAGVAADAGFGDDAVARVRLATSEAATNAVMHAARNRPAPIDVIVTVNATELVVVVIDGGAGVNPRPDSPGAGVGVEIIRAVTDRAEWRHPETGGTAVRMGFLRPT